MIGGGGGGGETVGRSKTVCEGGEGGEAVSIFVCRVCVTASKKKKTAAEEEAASAATLIRPAPRRRRKKGATKRRIEGAAQVAWGRRGGCFQGDSFYLPTLRGRWNVWMW